MMTSDIDEGMMEEDDGPVLVDEEHENATDIVPFGLNDAKPVVMDNLGLHEEVNAKTEEPSDATEEQVDDDIMEDNAGLLLGECVNLPR